MKNKLKQILRAVPILHLLGTACAQNDTFNLVNSDSNYKAYSVGLDWVGNLTPSTTITQQPVATDKSAELFSDLTKAHANLGNGAKQAIETSKGKKFDEKLYTWGMTVPTWSFPADPLAKECLGQLEMFQGDGCPSENSARALNKINWERIRQDLNFASRDHDYCMIGYDMLGSS